MQTKRHRLICRLWFVHTKDLMDAFNRGGRNLFFSKKAQAALDFFDDTVRIFQRKGKIHFENQVFSSWEELASWLEKFADDMASDGYPLV